MLSACEQSACYAVTVSPTMVGWCRGACGFAVLVVQESGSSDVLTGLLKMSTRPEKVCQVHDWAEYLLALEPFLRGMPFYAKWYCETGVSFMPNECRADRLNILRSAS